MKDKLNRSIACSCLDAIDDTEDAIIYFNKKLRNINYLHLCGILQILFTQYEALSNLYSIFFGEKHILTDKLKNIKEIRNKSIGHPTKRYKGSYVIHPPSISKKSYRLAFYPEDGSATKIDSINLSETILDQYNEIKIIQNNIIIKTKSIKDSEKERFNNEKLKMPTYKNLNYSLEKLLENNKDLFYLNLEVIKDFFYKNKSLLEERYDSNLSDIDGLESLLGKIEYILGDINSSIKGPKLEIYIDSLKSYLLELNDIYLI